MSDILKMLGDVVNDRNPEEDTWDGWQIAEEAIAEIKKLRSEVERLRGEQQLRAERMLTTGLVGETGRVVQLQRDWRQVVAERNADIARLAAEVERLRLEPSVQEEIVAWSVDLHDARQEIKRLTAEVERLRLRDHEPETLGTAEHIVRLAGFTQTADDIAAIAARLGGGE